MINFLAPITEEWLSGRRHRTRNAAGEQSPREFESHLFRSLEGCLSVYKNRQPVVRLAIVFLQMSGARIMSGDF